MRTRRWGLRITVALLIGLAGTGCDDLTDADTDAGAPQTPIGRERDKQAPGGPAKVPAITRNGQDLAGPDGVRTEIEQKFRQACGGQLCVRLVEEPRGDPDTPGLTKCQFVGLDPKAGTEVARGARVVIVTGDQECVSPDGEDDLETPQEEPDPQQDGAEPDGPSPEATG